ncbi:MAG TPA: hypothetical protein VK593_01480, partial [Edaphobacter sp.]|nr:hypothetical protein [Edaphobacter sp.]
MTLMTPLSPSNTHAAASAGVQLHSSNPQLDALLYKAGIAPLDQAGWIRVTGSDRVRWLNGMVTNSVQLEEGAGAYNFFLNAQGRIQADGNIFAAADELLIETGRSQVAKLIPYLDHYIIMDDVELADMTDSRHGLILIGPQAASLLAQLGVTANDLSPLKMRASQWNSTIVTLLHAHSPLVPRYELWTDSADAARELHTALEDAGATP